MIRNGLRERSSFLHIHRPHLYLLPVHSGGSSRMSERVFHCEMMVTGHRSQTSG
jgi:hypothetical protein